MVSAPMGSTPMTAVSLRAAPTNRRAIILAVFVAFGGFLFGYGEHVIGPCSCVDTYILWQTLVSFLFVFFLTLYDTVSETNMAGLLDHARLHQSFWHV
jgi:hypothetical protein